jgi:hypothetical protein
MPSSSGTLLGGAAWLSGTAPQPMRSRRRWQRYARHLRKRRPGTWSRETERRRYARISSSVGLPQANAPGPRCRGWRDGCGRVGDHVRRGQGTRLRDQCTRCIRGCVRRRCRCREHARREHACHEEEKDAHAVRGQGRDAEKEWGGGEGTTGTQTRGRSRSYVLGTNLPRPHGF